MQRGKVKVKIHFRFPNASFYYSLSFTLINNNDWSLWSFACIFFLLHKLSHTHIDFTLLFPGPASTCFLSQYADTHTQKTREKEKKIFIIELISVFVLQTIPTPMYCCATRSVICCITYFVEQFYFVLYQPNCCCIILFLAIQQNQPKIGTHAPTKKQSTKTWRNNTPLIFRSAQKKTPHEMSLTLNWLAKLYNKLEFIARSNES